MLCFQRVVCFTRSLVFTLHLKNLFSCHFLLGNYPLTVLFSFFNTVILNLLPLQSCTNTLNVSYTTSTTWDIQIILMRAFRTFAHTSHKMYGCKFPRLESEVQMQYSDTHAPKCGHLQDSLSSARHQINTPCFPLWQMEEVWKEDSKLAFSNQHAWWRLAAVNRSILSAIWHSAWCCCVSRCSRDTYCSLFQRRGRLVKGGGGVSVYY